MRCQLTAFLSSLLRRLAAATVSLMVVSLITVTQPQSSSAIPWFGSQTGEPTAAQTAVMQKMETDFLPQLKAILSPEQEAQFATTLETGGDLRKAFNSVTLTPEQKAKVSSLFKSLSKGSFATLTPDQKQEFFLKQKAAFMKGKGQFMPNLSGISEKKKAFMPNLDQIAEQKKAFMPDLSKFIPGQQAEPVIKPVAEPVIAPAESSADQ